MHAETLLQRRLSLSAALALSAIAMMMVTDNTFVYVFVMAPLGILLGASLAGGGFSGNATAHRDVRGDGEIVIVA